MKKLNRTSAPLGIAVFLLALSASARANTVSVNLFTSTLSGLPGGTLTFSGTLVNNAGTDAYINTASIDLPAFGAADYDLTDFVWNATGLLGSSLSIGPVDFFTVTIPAGLPSGLYTGTLFVQGGATDSEDAVLGATPFQVQVRTPTSGSVPEPGTMVLFLPAIWALWLRRRRRQASIRPARMA